MSIRRGMSWLKITKLLVSAGADLAAQDSQGDTPLHIAAKMGSGKIVKLLVNQGDALRQGVDAENLREKRIRWALMLAKPNCKNMIAADYAPSGGKIQHAIASVQSQADELAASHLTENQLHRLRLRQLRLIREEEKRLLHDISSASHRKGAKQMRFERKDVEQKDAGKEEDLGIAHSPNTATLLRLQLRRLAAKHKARYTSLSSHSHTEK